MKETLDVQTVTYGRKLPIEKWGNAEYIVTCRLREGQTVEDVMCSLRNVVKVQLDKLRSEEGDRE